MFDYSVIVPAYNEERHLSDTLRNLQKAMAAVEPLRGEIIVVDNNSTDRTAEIAREAGALVVFEAHNQISRARNCGGKAANSPNLVFLDADTRISPAILRKSLEMLLSGKYYGGGIKVGFPEAAPLLIKLFIKLWNSHAVIRKWVAGCYIFCLKETFDDIGGFREDVYAAEEIYFAKSMAKWGRKRQLSFGYISSEFIETSSRKIDEHSITKLLAIMLLLGAFPFLQKSRRMCKIWYNR
jgi:glycosyltransferase involved in cell wall biosynthesis